MKLYSIRLGFAVALFTFANFASSEKLAAQTSETTHAFTYLEVAPDAGDKAMEALAKYRDASRAETDNLEFTVMRGIERPNHFLIVEGWRTADAFAKHDQGAAAATFATSWSRIRISPPDRHAVEPFTLAPARQAPAQGQIYMIEHIDFMPPGRDVAPGLVRALAEAARGEAGNIRYDVFRQPLRRNNHYQVVSVWATPDDFRAHEIGAAARHFRVESAPSTPAERANLQDQRLFRSF